MKKAINTGSKYKNIKTEINGIKFDSKKEASRYQELLRMQTEGEIKDLRLQPTFTLIEGFKDALTGEVFRPLRYVADFSYKRLVTIAYTRMDGKEEKEKEWRIYIEDVKGRRTKEYLIKRKMMMNMGYHVLET